VLEKKSAKAESRMKYRQLALVGVLLVAVAIVARLTPEPILKLANTPEPTTIDELRRGDRIKKLKACSVPSVARGDGWIRLRGPDDFFDIDLPRTGSWKRSTAVRVSFPTLAQPSRAQRAIES